MHLHYRLAALGLWILIAGSAAAYNLTVATDADTYRIGDVVHIAVTNPTDHTISCNSYPIIGIQYVPTSACVYGCIGLPVIEDLPAGAVVTIDHDTGGGAEAPGEYRVVVFEIYDGGFPVPDRPSTSYVLVDPTPDETTAWGGVKTLYR